MTYKYTILFICTLIFSVISCSPDEDDVVSVPENDRTEQQVIDNDSLVGYLNTHYYNSAEVNALANPTIVDVVITELLEDETLPSDATLLMTAAELKTTTYLDVEYNYYILEIKQGDGASSPRFCDKVRVKYAGSLTDGVEFEAKTTPVDFDLTGVIPGWSRVMPEFNGGTFTTYSDGTVSYEGYGMGVMFLPSGLGYFAASRTSIPSYSNLVFKFELLQTETADHDFDNIPTYMEVVEQGGLNLYDKDTDGDLIPDFNDSDDDGDGTLTKNELGVETYTESTKEALEAILDNLDLDANQLITPIKYNTDRNNFTANLITLVDTNENGTYNYLDDTESNTVE